MSMIALPLQSASSSIDDTLGPSFQADADISLELGLAAQHDCSE